MSGGLSFSDRRKRRPCALAEIFVVVSAGVEEGAALATRGAEKNAVALSRMSSEEGNVLPTTSTTAMSAATYKIKGMRSGHRSGPLVVVGAISRAYRQHNVGIATFNCNCEQMERMWRESLPCRHFVQT